MTKGQACSVVVREAKLKPGVAMPIQSGLRMKSRAFLLSAVAVFLIPMVFAAGNPLHLASPTAL